MRRWIWSAGVAMGLVAGIVSARADKTLVIKSVTAAEFVRLNVENVGGVLTLCGTYQLQDAAGLPVGPTKARCVTLTAAQRTTFVLFIRDELGLILKTNQAEGLEP